MGLLRPSAELYSLPHGYYGLSSILLLLAMMALARLKSIEQLRYVAPGEWGNLLGLDRIPEVRTLRAKLELLCQQAGRAVQWNTALANGWGWGLQPNRYFMWMDMYASIKAKRRNCRAIMCHARNCI
jgi:hypothetical protein